MPVGNVTQSLLTIVFVNKYNAGDGWVGGGGGIAIHRFNHYRQVSNIRRTLVGKEIDDHSDVVGASPVGAAPTTSSFST